MTSSTHDEAVGNTGVARRRRVVGWGPRAAAVVAVAACLLSGSLVWLILSRPLEVAGALAGEHGWRVAIALGRLLAGSAANLVTWL